MTGLARCGKDTAAKYLAEKYGFKHLDFAKDSLFPKAEKKGIESTKINLALLGDELRQAGGQGVLAKTIAEKMKEDMEADYIITGFRSPEEVDYIRNECEDDFWLIEIYADKIVRYQRRNEDDPQSIEEFFSRDKRDINNKGLGDVLKMAEFKLSNEGSVEELKKLLNDLMKRIGK